jgi:hypothetical protein
LEPDSPCCQWLAMVMVDDDSPLTSVYERMPLALAGPTGQLPEGTYISTAAFDKKELAVTSSEVKSFRTGGQRDSGPPVIPSSPILALQNPCIRFSDLLHAFRRARRKECSSTYVVELVVIAHDFVQKLLRREIGIGSLEASVLPRPDNNTTTTTTIMHACTAGVPRTKAPASFALIDKISPVENKHATPTAYSQQSLHQ